MLGIKLSRQETKSNKHRILHYSTAYYNSAKFMTLIFLQGKVIVRGSCRK